MTIKLHSFKKLFFYVLLVIAFISAYTFSAHAQDRNTTAASSDSVICNSIPATGYISGNFLSSTSRTVQTGDTLVTTGVLENQTNLFVPSSRVYVVLYSGQDAGEQLLPVAIQEAGQNINLAGDAVEQVTLEWQVPTFLADGEYMAYLYVTQTHEPFDLWSEVIAITPRLREQSNSVSYNITNQQQSAAFLDFVESISVNGIDKLQTDLVEMMYSQRGDFTTSVQLHNSSSRALQGNLIIAAHSDFAPTSNNTVRETSQELRVLSGSRFELLLETTIASFGSISVWYESVNGDKQLLRWIPVTTDFDSQNIDFNVDNISRVYPVFTGIAIHDDNTVFACVQSLMRPGESISTAIHNLSLKLRQDETVLSSSEQLLFGGEGFDYSGSGNYMAALAHTDTSPTEIVLSMNWAVEEESAGVPATRFTRVLAVDFACSSLPGFCGDESRTLFDAGSNTYMYYVKLVGIVLATLLTVVLIIMIRRRSLTTQSY